MDTKNGDSYNKLNLYIISGSNNNLNSHILRLFVNYLTDQSIENLIELCGESENYDKLDMNLQIDLVKTGFFLYFSSSIDRDEFKTENAEEMILQILHGFSYLEHECVCSMLQPSIVDFLSNKLLKLSGNCFDIALETIYIISRDSNEARKLLLLNKSFLINLIFVADKFLNDGAHDDRIKKVLNILSILTVEKIDNLELELILKVLIKLLNIPSDNKTIKYISKIFANISEYRTDILNDHVFYSTIINSINDYQSYDTYVQLMLKFISQRAKNINECHIIKSHYLSLYNISLANLQTRGLIFLVITESIVKKLGKECLDILIKIDLLSIIRYCLMNLEFINKERVIIIFSFILDILPIDIRNSIISTNTDLFSSVIGSMTAVSIKCLCNILEIILILKEYDLTTGTNLSFDLLNKYGVLSYIEENIHHEDGYVSSLSQRILT